MLNPSPSKPNSYAWLVLALSAGFLFYKYILQVSPSVMAIELMHAYSLSATKLGFLVSFYFYTYLIMQIPAGILLDRYGPHKIATLAILICSSGILIFSQTTSLSLACFARLLIGFGGAFATTSYMKISSRWFPPTYFPLLSGLFGTACMAGAGTAQAPLAWLISISNWQLALVYCAVFGFILAGLFFIFVQDKPQHYALVEINQPRFSWINFLQMFTNRSNWPLIFFGGFAFTPIAVFGGLWGTPFLSAAYHLSRTAAASSVSLVFVGFALGGILTGFIGKNLSRQLPVLVIGTSSALVCFSLILYLPELPLTILNLLIFVLGLSASSFLLSYSIAKHINNAALVATVIGVINMGDPICAAIAEPLIGKILDLNWDGKVIDHVRIFATPAYHYGLSVLTAYFILALFCCLFIHEKPQTRVSQTRESRTRVSRTQISRKS